MGFLQKSEELITKLHNLLSRKGSASERTSPRKGSASKESPRKGSTLRSPRKGSALASPRKGSALLESPRKSSKSSAATSCTEWDPSNQNGRSLSSTKKHIFLMNPRVLKTKLAFKKRYNLSLDGDLLGHGRTGVVVVCTNKSTGEKLACKVVDKKNLLLTWDEVKSLELEVLILQEILPPHPNIISLRDIFEDKKTVHLVMDLCHGGQLFSRVFKYSAARVQAVFRQIVEAVAFCHSHGVVHRDLKPQNILFRDDRDDSPVVKIIDFGLSMVDPKRCLHTTFVMKEAVGTMKYMAPELHRILARRSGSYDCGVDVWALGVVLYEMLCGYECTPFESYQEVMDSTEGVSPVKLKFVREAFPRSAVDLLEKMLCHDPRRRISAGGALDHPWLSDGNSESQVGDQQMSLAEAGQGGVDAPIALEPSCWIHSEEDE